MQVIERWLKNARPWPLPTNGGAYAFPVVVAVVLAAVLFPSIWFFTDVAPTTSTNPQTLAASPSSIESADSSTDAEQAETEMREPFQNSDGLPVDLAAYPITATAPLVIPIGNQKTAGNVLPILMYHYIRVNLDPSDTIGIGLSVTPSEFERQMRFLSDSGYRTMTLEDLATNIKNGSPMPARTVVLTFDDGYADFRQAAYPVLRQYGFKATSFVITDLVGRQGYLTWPDINEMDAGGIISFGAHTLNHPDLTAIALTSAEKQIKDSKSALETHLGHPVVTFAYPSGDYNAAVMRLVEAAGFQCAVTTRYGNAHQAGDLYQLKRIRIDGRDSLSVFVSKMQLVEPPGGFVTAPAATPTRIVKPTATITATARATVVPTPSPTLPGGPSPTLSAVVAVPNVVGLSEADARSRLTAAGLNSGYVNYQKVENVDAANRNYFLSFSPGTVVSQQTAAGASVKRGTAITFAVRK